MAKNSRRVAAALQALVPKLEGLDSLPPLSSVALMIFFEGSGDRTEVTPRYTVRTNRADLTVEPAPP